MGRYVLRRLAITPLLLLGIATVAFIIARLIPADPLASIVGERQMNNETIVNAAKERWGLGGGVIEQYVSYIRNLVTGDLGTSFRTKNSVASDLWERLPATAELAMCALFVAAVGGIALGVVSAATAEQGARPRRPGGGAGRVVDAGVLARADHALRLLRPPRLVPRTWSAPVARRPAAEGDRPVHGRLAARRRSEPGVGLHAPADAAGDRPRLVADGHRVAPRAGRDARRAARRLRPHGPGEGAARAPGHAPPRAAQRARRR